MSFAATILTLYPEMFPGPLGISLAGRALSEGKWTLDAVNIRDFAIDRHRTVDDTPAGGGAGMVLRVDVLAAAIDSVPGGRPVLAMTPRGAPLTQARIRQLAGDPASRSCADGSRDLTNASSKRAASRKCRSATISCQAGRWARWCCSTLAFGCFPA